MSDGKINIKSYHDLPIAPASLGKMTVNKTASWRNAEPYYEDKAAPCNLSCPSGTDVVDFIHLLGEGKYQEGLELILETNPFPGVCGRVCPHPCERECNRGNLGGQVNVHMLERFLADSNFEKSLKPKFLEEKKSQSVGVIGAGPAGLSCAYQLARRGYAVTVYDSLPEAGGMMRLGIPDYRLPKDVLQQEINYILAHGVELRLNTRVGEDISFEEIRKQHAAVFIGTGYTLSRSLGADGQELEDVIPGIEVLRKISFHDNIELGDRVVVVGGGNTAMDVARSVLRMGSKARVVYRRSREEMPAIAEEVDDLLEEGIPIDFLTLPVKVHGDAEGRVLKVECMRMTLGEPDASGRRRPIPLEGSNFDIEADMVVTAIGEQPDLRFLPSDVKAENWGVLVDGNGRTNIPGIYAGGDTANGEGTVTHAVGRGRQAALALDAYIQGKEPPRCEEVDRYLKDRTRHQVAWQEMNPAYFNLEERVEPQGVAIPARVRNFEEIYSGLSEERALQEAQRCFSCGVCPECDNCLVFCPDAAISRKEGGRYQINYDYCKGCGICVSECPRNAISIKVLK